MSKSRTLSTRKLKLEMATKYFQKKVLKTRLDGRCRYLSLQPPNLHKRGPQCSLFFAASSDSFLSLSSNSTTTWNIFCVQDASQSAPSPPPSSPSILALFCVQNVWAVVVRSSKSSNSSKERVKRKKMGNGNSFLTTHNCCLTAVLPLLGRGLLLLPKPSRDYVLDRGATKATKKKQKSWGELSLLLLGEVRVSQHEQQQHKKTVYEFLSILNLFTQQTTARSSASENIE